MVGLTPSVSAAQLIGEDPGEKFRAGEKAASDMQTAELNRQLAAAESRRAEKELAIRQAQEARRVRAAQLAEQQSRATMAYGAQFGQQVSGILKRMQEASQPGIVPPAQARPQVAPVAPSYSPLGMYGMYPGSTALGAPPTTPPPPPSAPSGAVPVAPPGGGPYAGAPPQPPTAAPRAGTTIIYDPQTGSTVVEGTPQPSAGAQPLDELQIERIERGAQPTPPPPLPGMMRLGADMGEARTAQGAQPRTPTIEDAFSQLNPDARKYVTTIRERLQSIGAVPELADKNTASVRDFKASQKARQEKFDENLKRLQTFSPGFVSSSPPQSLPFPQFYRAAKDRLLKEPKSVGRTYLESRYTTAEVERMLDFDKQAQTAQKWYSTAQARKIFEARPDLFQLAKLNPASFYEQYKDVKPEDIPAAAPTAGVAPTAPTTAPTTAAAPAPGSEALRFSSITGITAAAPPEVQAVAKGDAKAVQRLIEPTSGVVTTSDVIKAVINTKDPDKIRAPNILQYASDPPKASREVRQAELTMQLLAASVRYYGSMARFNPAAVAKTLDLVQRYQTAVAQRDALRGAQAIALFTSGDTRLAEQILSERQGVEVRFIPNPNNPGTFDRFENRQLIRSAISSNVLLDALRRDLEVGYKESMIKTAATKLKYEQELLMELVKGGVQVSKERLAQAKITKVESDGRSAKYVRVTETGDIYEDVVTQPDPKSSTKPGEALAPTVRTTLISRGGGGSNVPTDPNKE